jgi:hypothetical protein
MIMERCGVITELRDAILKYRNVTFERRVVANSAKNIAEPALRSGVYLTAVPEKQQNKKT